MAAISRFKITMFPEKLRKSVAENLAEIKAAGFAKDERVLLSPQRAVIGVSNNREVLNFCANNYLGLAAHPDVIQAAHLGLERWGYGLASVRFICGTQQIHKELEEKLSAFLGMEDTILYSSCFDANGGLFETVLGPEDAVISDELNHASIIDGVRLCKARRFRYRNNNMADLELRLQEAGHEGQRMVVTDGVFSMDGTIANLPAICDLAEKYEALVAVDDSHAVGFMGAQGRGTHEFHDVMNRVDIITGTLGKALGGGSGGYTSGPQEIVDLLRQRSRPYLFSNSVLPVVACAAVKALEILGSSAVLRDRLMANAAFFRASMTRAGFSIIPGEHPIVPVMLGDAALADRMANLLLTKGVYVIGFSYPVVPQGKARIRVQISASHSMENIAFAVEAFVAAAGELGVVLNS